MKSKCIRKYIEESSLFLPRESDIIRLSLLVCNVCKKMDNHEEILKNEALYVLPLLLSFRKDGDSSDRIKRSNLMERTAERFGNADDGQVKDFMMLLLSVSQGKGRYTVNDLLQLSEGSYCKVIAILYMFEKYDLIRMLALQYIYNNARIGGSHLRNNWYHKDEEQPFFVIGVGLDEGITESIVCEMFKENTDKLSDAYFFEKKFVDEIIDTFNLERKTFLSDDFPFDCLGFLGEETKKKDYCDFYDILKLSDQQKWKDVFLILQKYKR